jgi:hypothetical protein
MGKRVEQWKSINKLEFEIRGLKCDYCDYRDDSVKFTEYLSSIGKKCPKCGNNLLTKKEYDDCVKIYIKMAQLEKVLGIFKWFNPLNYFRFIFGIKCKTYTFTKDYPNRNIE